MNKLNINLETKALIHDIHRNNLEQLIRLAYLTAKLETFKGNVEDEHKKFIEKHRDIIDLIVNCYDTERI